MQPKVLTTIFQYAVNEDMKAAKLYLETTSALQTNPSSNAQNSFNKNTLIQNQNNVIQINGMVLNQQTVQLLKPEQLNTIEEILKTIEIKDQQEHNDLF